MRISEVQELEGYEEDLSNLSVQELHIEEVVMEGSPSLWQAVVIIEAHVSDKELLAHPWTLAMRGSSDEARSAAVAFLRRISKARRRTMRDFPPVDDAVADAYGTARVEAVIRCINRWHDRGVSESASMNTPGPTSGVPSELETWAAAIRRARTQDGRTQVYVAAKAGLTQARLSRLERAMSVPTQHEAHQLAEVLGVDPPFRSAGGEEVD